MTERRTRNGGGGRQTRSGTSQQQAKDQANQGSRKGGGKGAGRAGTVPGQRKRTGHGRERAASRRRQRPAEECPEAGPGGRAASHEAPRRLRRGQKNERNQRAGGRVEDRAEYE